MKNLKVSAAVAAALLMAQGAHALTPTEVNAAATIKLVVAGASAARDTFASEFQAVCASNINLYQATPSGGHDFRAYSCTLGAAAGALSGSNAVVYYRSEGGSAWGPGSVAKNQQIIRLVVDGTCSVVAPPNFGACAASGYSLNTDTGTGHLVRATTDLAVSDEEPGMYRGENWVGVALGGEPAPGVLEALPASQGFAQTFGIIVPAALPITSISAQDVASIFAGTATNWNQVQDQTTGNALPSQTIRVCRREPGSGTQVSAAVHFLNQNCSTSSEPFVVGNGVRVFENSTTSLLEGCAAVAGSVGMNIYKSTPPAGTKYLALDGVAPSKINAARGTYDYWFESSFVKRPGLSGNADVLADLLIARAADVNGIPAGSASAFAIPFLTPNNNPVLPVAAAGTPVAVGTKLGNSCKAALGQL